MDRKTQADLVCLKFKLAAETALFESHQLATQEWEHASQNARATRLEQLDKLVQESTNSYADLRFPTLLVGEKDEAARQPTVMNHIPS